jgi:hypothetical protein
MMNEAERLKVLLDYGLHYALHHALNPDKPGARQLLLLSTLMHASLSFVAASLVNKWHL